MLDVHLYDAGHFLLETHAAEVAELLVTFVDDGLVLNPPDRPVRRCDRCGWFFLDHSRGRRRRWCSMKTCGNQAKAARYRATHP